MPDGLPVAEGGRPKGSGGNHWLIIGAVAGIGTLAILMLQNKSGSATGTTAAGTSINAALGSIQEQNLNIMGQASSNERALWNEINNVNGNVITGFNAMSLQQQADVARQFADFTYIEAGPSDPRINEWIAYSSQLAQQWQATLASLQKIAAQPTPTTAA